MTAKEALEVLADYLREEQHDNPDWGPEDDYAPCPGDTCAICQLWDAHAVFVELELLTRKPSKKGESNGTV